MSNPLGFCNSTQNWQKFAGKTGMLVPGRCNRYDPAFAAARAAGAEVLPYFNFVERPNNRVCALDAAFYMGDNSKVPLWPYPRPGARQNSPTAHMTDIREGSPWFNHALGYIQKLMDDERFSGVFLDVLGARLWDRAGWKDWPVKERAEWTNGCVAFVREVDRLRRSRTRTSSLSTTKCGPRIMARLFSKARSTWTESVWSTYRSRISRQSFRLAGSTLTSVIGACSGSHARGTKRNCARADPGYHARERSKSLRTPR